MSLLASVRIGLVSIVPIVWLVSLVCSTSCAGPKGQREEQQQSPKKNDVITCRFERDSTHRSEPIVLYGSPATIEFTDLIGPDAGGGDRVEGQLVDGGKAVQIRLETGMSAENRSNTTVVIHTIDASLLPRRIPVDGMLLKGFVVIERSVP